MNSVKVERTAKCLQAVALIYVLQALYFNLKLVALGSSFSRMAEGSDAGFTGPALISIATATALSVGAFVVSRELKAGKGWAWIAGLSICLFTLPTFCLPASILGLLTLLDRDVREPYLSTFEFKF